MIFGFSYVVAQGFRATNPAVVDYLLHVNDRLSALNETTRSASGLAVAVADTRTVDIIRVVADEVIDPVFLTALTDANTAQARLQSRALHKVISHVRVRWLFHLYVFHAPYDSNSGP